MIEAKKLRGNKWVTGSFNEHTWPAAQKAGWVALDSSSLLSPEMFPEIKEVARKNSTVVEPVIADEAKDNVQSEIEPVNENAPETSAETAGVETPEQPEPSNETKGRGRPKK
jgi:hypothetical protein